MIRKTKIAFLITLFLCFLSLSMVAQVKLPRLISDGMVLQRDARVKVWGWAARGEKVTVKFLGSTYSATADTMGEWAVQLSGLKAGGPCTMTIDASNSITINNILIGDVWVCSGQSNMELPMRRVRPLYEQDVAEASNTYIRYFAVPQKYNFNAPQTDLSGGMWESPNPTSVLSFSAVAYFFGAELYAKYHVPVGLINTSLGGSPAESWMSEEALRQFPKHFQEAQRFKNADLIRQIESQDKARIDAWYELLKQKDEGYKDPQRPWFSPAVSTDGWPQMHVPGYWAGTTLGPVNGVVWFRRDFDIPESMTGRPGTLNLGRLVDADSVFVNGVFVGTTSYQYPPRWYDLPSTVLKKGRNTIVVRVISNIGKGGFVPDKPYEIVCAGQTIDLKGEWKYRLGAAMDPLAGQTFVRWKPLGLYNAMLSPLLNYAIKGAAWYQGESNAERPAEYCALLPALIRDWRTQWNEGDFPFLIVQLPNFMEPKSQPSESNWALLREAQMDASSLPNTGVVVTIDLGEWNDIHPLNKKDVGKRLTLAAAKMAYADETVVSSGPVYTSMRTEGNKIILSFTNTGSGLVAKGKDLDGFAIAGADKRFVWAHATIKGNTVVVWSEDVSNPVAVRYAWADNPSGAGLYNVEGLPAAPFRTDSTPF
ncbi:MAG: sialate O-acetylesterase [Ignavibacteriales bacterium]|nr:sialate O-acetylesterase [Ignavibacteriales bacterium]